MGRPLTGAFRRHEQELALAVAGAALCAIAVAPFASLLLREGAAWVGAPFALASSGALALLLRSLVLSTLVTLLALAMGLPLGVLVGRTDVRGRWWASLLHAFPALLPPFLLALGWFHLLGVSGLLGSQATSSALFSEAGVVFVLALAFAPIATSLVALGLQGVDPGLEEAARVVAGPFRVVVRILIPAAAPAIVLAAIVIFTLSLSELDVPMFLRVDTFPAAVFSRLGGVDYAPGEALAMVLPLLPLALLLLAAERRFVGSRSFAVLGRRSGREDRLALGRLGRVASAVLWLAALLSAAPIAALAWRALSGGGAAGAGPWLGRALEQLVDVGCGRHGHRRNRARRRPCRGAAAARRDSARHGSGARVRGPGRRPRRRARRSLEPTRPALGLRERRHPRRGLRGPLCRGRCAHDRPRSASRPSRPPNRTRLWPWTASGTSFSRPTSGPLA
jgi:ABC-type Fe3+ transport system permease subunit